MAYATHTIFIPGTLSPGYHRGHHLPDDVIANWNLVEGDDYSAEPPTDETAPQVVERPVDDSDRGAWVAYVISRGTDPDEANDMDLADLMALYPDEDAAENAPERPADSARKAEWVEWAIESGADETWARDDGTTKAELQAYEPGKPLGHDHHSTTDPAADQGNATVGA